MQTTVSKCRSCGSEHDIDAKKLWNRTGAWTHWYMCDVTSDPVMVRITSGEQDMHDAIESVCQSLDTAMAVGAFLVAIAMPEGSEVRVHRVTYRFPQDRFIGVLDALRTNLEAEIAPPPNPVLRPALPPGIPVKLFGDE